MISNKLKNILSSELTRQQNSLELVASENYVSKNVLDAYSNVFTNKYSEGYPGARYYGGQEFVDELEIYTQYLSLRIFDLCENYFDEYYGDGQRFLSDEEKTNFPFNIEYINNILQKSDRGVNVQPLSGSVANLAVYIGLLKPSAKILAMSLSAGGHLTHGHPLNASGKLFEIIPYGVDENGYIDYEQVRNLALEHKPDLILAGFSAYPRNIDRKKFADIRNELFIETDEFSYLMADISHIAGLIAGGKCGNPFEYFDIVTTTTHKTLRGPRGALIYYSKNWKFENIDKDGAVKKTTLGDKINRGVFPGVQGGPFDHVMYAKAVALEEILDPETRRSEYISAVIKNSQTIANYLSEKGRSIATNGTDNHIILIDVTQKNGIATGFAGKQAEKALEYIGLSANKNSIPNDPRKPLDPSGIRIGTPAITTRGFDADDCLQLAEVIDICFSNIDDKGELDIYIRDSLTERVMNLCQKYPLRY